MQVLQRIVSVIKFITARGLALRGDDEIIGSSSNGNYLGILELLAEYDPFLATHMKEHANKGSGHVNYLSSTICEELIELMANQLLDEIIRRREKAKYFSISLDSSPDEGHIDELTVILRYMEGLHSVERFLTFIPNCGHSGKDIAEAAVKFLTKRMNIEIRDCRGQSYDNALNMTGKYKGVQARILEVAPFAIFFACLTHSLNLVGLFAVKNVPMAVYFFDFVENLYVFFTSSTGRYKILCEKLLSMHGQTYSLKQLSDTRWSCRADATKALKNDYPAILEALKSISDDGEEKDVVRNQARGLAGKMIRLETAILTEFWYSILDRFNGTSVSLQNPNINVNTALSLVTSLRSFVEGERDRFESYEEAGRAFSESKSYTPERVRRVNIRNQPLESTSSDTTLDPRDKFRTQVFLPAIDNLLKALDERIAAYDKVRDRFGFLANLEYLSQSEPDKLEEHAKKLVEWYPEDLEPTLGNELKQLGSLVKEFDQKPDEAFECFLYRIICEEENGFSLKSTFPNCEILLRIYLTIMVTNSTGERSFSKMKLIKNRLRTSMSTDRLANLALMSIENDILKELEFESIIRDFAFKKSRKKSFL